jgi:hypothetical protein
VNEYSLSIAKIHGTVDPVEIIPPTWNKTNRPGIEKVWRLASELICKANHIRFIGYSMPQSDIHLKYLLSAGIVHSDNLKSIDVICLNNVKNSSSVEKRYRKVFGFRDFRFKNADIIDYFEKNVALVLSDAKSHLQELHFNRLEEAHRQFFEE